jgi:hypothetical protein
MSPNTWWQRTVIDDVCEVKRGRPAAEPEHSTGGPRESAEFPTSVKEVGSSSVLVAQGGLPLLV